MCFHVFPMCEHAERVPFELSAWSLVSIEGGPPPRVDGSAHRDRVGNFTDREWGDSKNPRAKPMELSLHVPLDWIHAYGPNHVHQPGAKHIAQNDVGKPRLVCPNPKPDAYYLDTRTGEYEPSRCERNTCAVCCVINSWYIAAAIKRAEPDYVLVLTQVGIAWSDTSKRLNRFFYHLAQWYPTVKYGFQVEFNPCESRSKTAARDGRKRQHCGCLKLA